MEELSPRQRRHQRTYDAILEAARDIIHERGVDALSIRSIAERIDYSPAGLYEYFGSKEEIIAAVCMQGHRRLKQYLESVDSSLPMPEYLTELGMAYVRFALQNRQYFLLMFTSIFQTDQSQPERVQTMEGMMGEHSSFPILLNAIRRGIEEGLFVPRPGFDLMEMAFATWSLVHGAAMLRTTMLHNVPLDWEHATREALHSQALGLQK